MTSGKSLRRHSRSLVLVYPLRTRRCPGLPRRQYSRLSHRLPWRPVRMVWESIRSIRRSDQPRPRQVDGHCTLYRCSVYTRRQRKEGIENGMGRLYPVLLTKRRLADGGNGGNFRCPIGEEGRVLPREKYLWCKGSESKRYSNRPPRCAACRRNHICIRHCCL